MIQPRLPADRQRYLREWLLLLAALLALGGYICYSLYQEHQQIELRERERLLEQTLVIEKNLVSQLASISKFIDSVIETLPSWPLKPDGFKLLNRQLQITADSVVGLRAILLIDARGRVLSSNRGELIGRDFSAREYFQAARKSHDSKTLQVSPPFQGALNPNVMGFSRTISAPGGELAGIVLASASPETFRILLDSVRYSSDSATSLIHGDGKIFMLVPDREDLAGKDLATPESYFSRHRQSGRPASVFTGGKHLAGDERMIAFRTVQPATLFMDKPLVVSVSRDFRTLFANWYRESMIAGGMFALVTLVATLSLYFSQRRRRIFDRIAIEQDKSLRSSEARFRNMFERNNAVMLMIEPQSGAIVEANQAACSYYGYHSEALRRMSIDQINTLSPEEVAAERLRALHEERAYFNFSHRLAGGEVRSVEVHSSPIDVEGRPLLFSIVHDITEQLRLQQEMRIAAAAFESQQAMMITDASSVILRVNRAFTDLTGYAAEEAVGQTPRMLGSGRQNESFYQAMWETLERTGSWQGEIWDRRKNGEIFPKWLSISVVKDGAGRVTHYVGSHSDISERKKAEERINELAFFDQLTGLPNRTLLLDRMKQAMVASSRSGSYCALLFIDLDNFKTLNDTQGHEIGDLLLKLVAQRLTQCVREGDTVARLGGDEFLVVLAGLGASKEDAAKDIETITDKIPAALNQSYQFGNAPFHCTASIGVTLFKGDLASIDDLMKQADIAMYKAKEAGRNSVRFYDPTLEAAVQERVALEADLRLAIAENQFLVYYQAQVDAGDHCMGAEALIRWQHPQRGMVSPADFIPLAEETGLILPLGHWVLRTVCGQLAAWATRPELAHLAVAVNISAHQFHQADFVDQVLAVLKNTGANPLRLKLELTESLLVANVEDVIFKMRMLKSVGVGFSLDDFGTGYSSLAYLSRLPLDQLKIDRSFVMNIETDDSAVVICAATISLAHNLKLMVVAEGVETEAQRYFLTAVHHCDLIQGYLTSRPLPVAAFEAFVQTL